MHIPTRMIADTVTVSDITTTWNIQASSLLHPVDMRVTMTKMQFAPRFLSLQLAALSTDGILRIYEARVGHITLNY